MTLVAQADTAFAPDPSLDARGRAPISDGPMLELSASKSFATMSWKLHGMHFDACSTDYALAINSPLAEQPRAEHNNFKLFDVTFYNHLQNNSCPGRPPTPPKPGQAKTYATGAVYLAHIWSSQLEMGLATVSTSAPLSAFNDTAGVTLNEVQYTTLSLRGTGTHTDASFSEVTPWEPQVYNGWGIVMVANCNSNTVVQTREHFVSACLPVVEPSNRSRPEDSVTAWARLRTDCEGSGGCVLIRGPGNFENQWTTVTAILVAMPPFPYSS